MMQYLDAQKLSFAYRDNSIISNLSLTINSQELIHLQGLNGSGKTTLLKLLAGILKPAMGFVHCQCPCSYLGHRLGLHPELTVMENILYGLGTYRATGLDDLLRQANLYHLRDVAMKTLSLGQAHKLAFIGLVLQNTSLWLLDEPFANLDHLSEAWIWSLIHQHIRFGGSLVFTAHQRDYRAQHVMVWQL